MRNKCIIIMTDKKRNNWRKNTVLMEFTYLFQSKPLSISSRTGFQIMHKIPPLKLKQEA